jgi:hypothetical protein
MMNVEVSYTPRLSPVEQHLLKLPNRLRNLRPLMQRGIAPAFNAMLKRHWDSKGAAFGRRWAPWAESTRAARIAKGNAAKGLLRDTDHLFKVLFRERATDNRLRVVAGGVEFRPNVNVPYALFHQVGTSRMPERQVIPDPLPRSFKQECRAIVREFILTGYIPR